MSSPYRNMKAFAERCFPGVNFEPDGPARCDSLVALQDAMEREIMRMRLGEALPVPADGGDDDRPGDPGDPDRDPFGLVVYPMDHLRTLGFEFVYDHEERRWVVTADSFHRVASQVKSTGSSETWTDGRGSTGVAPQRQEGTQ